MANQKKTRFSIYGFIRSTAKDARFLSNSLKFCIVCQLADILSSMVAVTGSKLYETNPLVRHADGSFWLWHGVLVKTAWVVLFSVISFAVFLSLRHIKKVNIPAAQVISTIPLLYLGYTAAGAAGSNILLALFVGR